MGSIIGEADIVTEEHCELIESLATALGDGNAGGVGLRRPDGQEIVGVGIEFVDEEDGQEKVLIIGEVLLGDRREEVLQDFELVEFVEVQIPSRN